MVRRTTSSRIALTLASALVVGSPSGSDGKLRGGENAKFDGPGAPETNLVEHELASNDLTFIDPFEGFDYDQAVPLDFDYPSSSLSVAVAAAAAEDDRALQINVDLDETTTKNSKHGGHHREPVEEDGIDATSRIVNGRVADRLPAFAMTLDERNGERFRGVCGATLVSPRYAVTAAHCVSNYRPNDYRDKLDALYIGAYSPWKKCNNEKNCGKGYQIIAVNRVIPHPNHVPGAGSPNDMLIIELKESVDLSQFPDFVPVPLVNYALTDRDSGQVGHVYGFGQTSYGGAKSQDLMSVDVGYVRKDLCRSQMHEWTVTDDMICFGGGNNRKDSCGGDSGGPLIWRGAIAGVVSWGYKCAEPGRPGVYSSVYKLIDFIKGNVDGYSLQSADGKVTHYGANSYLNAARTVPKTTEGGNGAASASSNGASTSKSSCIDLENPSDNNARVTYRKGGLPKNKSCKVIEKKASNLCHRKLANSPGKVRDFCCHACRNHMTKQ